MVEAPIAEDRTQSCTSGELTNIQIKNQVDVTIMI